MKINHDNVIKEFKAALDRCNKEVWLMGPNDECYNMKNEEEYIAGILKWREGHDDQLGIFTTSCEDEAVMMDFCQRLAA